MNLTRVEIRNFKSIGSRQAVNLSRGLTVLTGRNGSGKCVAPWTFVEQPWGRATIASFFKEACSEGLNAFRYEGEYAVPSKKIPLVSYHPFLGKIVEARISAIFRKPYDAWLFEVETVTGRKIEITPEHRMMVVYGNSVHKWLEASRLSAGMCIMVFENGKTGVDTIYRIVKKRWRGEVYDVYVENVGSYIAGDGMVVHNSNLIDAIRFALGENNPRLLRTDRLASLVNDNVGREAEAYVKITIDNSDFMMPGQDKIITVARKMGRDGESTYYLNGKRTPKNVIEDMISSTGLSARGYNIILQGEISRLADKNPIERRKEIEQALGLAQYDEKKAEALSNLQQADNNLRVAQARLQEIDRRMLQLERERNILLRRRMLEKEVERIQTIINSLEYWKLVKRQDEISRNIDENIALRSRLETELISRQESKIKLMEKMEDLLKTAPLATPDTEKIKLAYELRDCERQLRETTGKIEENKNELSMIRRDLLKTRRKRGRMQRKIASLLKDSRKLLRKNSLINIQILHLLDEKKSLQEEDRKHSVEIANIANKLTLVNKDLERISLDEKNSEKMLREILTHHSNLRRRIRTLDRRRSLETARRNRMIEKLTGIERVLAERRRILDETMNTVKILMNSLDSFRIIFAKISGIAGYKTHSSKRKKLLDVVKKVAEKKGLNIYGILRENLLFPKDLVEAVESLAGEWIDAILVKNSLDMLFLVNFLGGKGIGVKVITSEGEVARREIPSELNGRGRHIMDILKYPKAVEKHVLKLFWNSVLANTVEDALVFAKNGFRAVTWHGEVFTSEGGLVREDEAGELEGLRSLVKGFSEKASELSMILETMNNNARPVLNRKIIEASDLRNRLSEGLKIIDSRMDELEEQLNTLTNEYLDASRRLSQMFRRHAIGKKRFLLRERERLKSLILAMEEKRREIRRRARLVESKLEKLEKEKNLVKNQLIRIENITTSLTKRMEDYKNFEKTLIDKNLKIKEENRQVLSQAHILNKKIEELSKGVSELREVKEERKDIHDELVAAIRKIDKEIERLNMEVNRVKDIERKLLVDKEVNESRIQELKNRIPGQPLEVSEDEESSAEHYLNILKNELEKVQEVNMLAISQYEQEVDFYRNALERINELEDERKSIQEFMEDIERRKREAFLDGLNRINNYFSSFFNKMTGGEGWLQLEDPEKPFEAGLTVYVRFPGKEARVISGVSGGEKSVAALCLVFAMQKLFPAVFYIFDEPDAHLDYVNVERMTDLLKEVSKDSQIIIVSLRDVVVSKADKVVGVYVKNGFSKFIEMPVGKALEETAIVG